MNAVSLISASCARLRRGLCREAVRVRRRVTALESHLVRALALGEPSEEPRVERHAALGPGIHLGYPTADAVRIELGVPGGIQRVADVDTLPIAADFDHLRTAVERLTVRARMRG